ncbi:MAG: hydroxymethylbilane synthase [Gemmataceae bacterium]
MKPFRIATRGSPLALWQAHHVANLLAPLMGQRQVELVMIETEGDRIRDKALSQIGGDGLFTKEVQRAVLEDRADLAVHSLKDLPTTPQKEFALGAVPERGPAGDAFVSRKYRTFAELPQGAAVGSSSLRRRSQLLYQRPDLQVTPLRGNVDTRIRKLETENLDAIILAEAGLRRLGLDALIMEILDRSWMLPAVGQGALGLECRANDQESLHLLEPLNHQETRCAVLAERAFLRCLGGGCLVPIGALAEVRGKTLILRGAVLPLDGSRRIAGEREGPMEDPETLGASLAKQMLDSGAGEVLSRAK